jgi:hypothetical protein
MGCSGALLHAHLCVAQEGGIQRRLKTLLTQSRKQTQLHHRVNTIIRMGRPIMRREGRGGGHMGEGKPRVQVCLFSPPAPAVADLLNDRSDLSDIYSLEGSKILVVHYGTGITVVRCWRACIGGTSTMATTSDDVL